MLERNTVSHDLMEEVGCKDAKNSTDGPLPGMPPGLFDLLQLCPCQIGLVRRGVLPDYPVQIVLRLRRVLFVQVGVADLELRSRRLPALGVLLQQLLKGLDGFVIILLRVEGLSNPVLSVVSLARSREPFDIVLKTCNSELEIALIIIRLCLPVSVRRLNPGCRRLFSRIGRYVSRGLLGLPLELVDPGFQFGYLVALVVDLLGDRLVPTEVSW